MSSVAVHVAVHDGMDVRIHATVALRGVRHVEQLHVAATTAASVVQHRVQLCIQQQMHSSTVM